MNNVGSSIDTFVKLEVTSCCVCGVKFAIPSEMLTNARNNGTDIYCPNGHCLCWKKTEAGVSL